MGLEIELEGIFGDGIAELVTYVPTTGDPIEVEAIVDREPYSPEQSGRGQYLLKRAAVMIPSAAIPPPSPTGDTIKFDGLEWAIDEYHPLGSSEVHLFTVLRDEVIKKAVRR